MIKYNMLLHAAVRFVYPRVYYRGYLGALSENAACVPGMAPDISDGVNRELYTTTLT